MSSRLLRVLSGAAVAGAVHAALNVALLRRPPAEPPPVRRPVTVVLPVRDEQDQVGGCLAAVLARRLARRPLPRVLVAAAVFAGWDVVLDPQMVQAGYWTWAHPRPGLPGIDTVPLTNLAGWLLAGLVLMALLDLLVARTALEPPRTGDGAPLLVLGWMTLGGALAHAGWLGLPGSAAWGVGLSVPVVAVLLARNRRAPRR